MRNPDREIRFMAARDVMTKLIESDGDRAFSSRSISGLLEHLCDPSREVCLNAQDCLMTAYISENKNLKGMCHSIFYSHSTDEIMSALINKLKDSTKPNTVVGQVIINLLRHPTCCTISPSIVDELISCSLSLIRSDSSTDPSLLFQMLDESLMRSSSQIGRLPTDSVSLLTQHIANRYVCHCLALVLAQSTDETFSKFMETDMSRIPNHSVIKMILAISDYESFRRFIPYIDPHVIPLLNTSLSDDCEDELLSAIACLQRFLIFQSKISGQKILTCSQVMPFVPLMKRLVSFGIDDSQTPPSDDGFEYSDDDNNSWRIRLAITELMIAILASNVSSPWKASGDANDTPTFLKSELEPLFIKQLSYGESHQSEVIALLTFFSTNQVDDKNRSELDNALATNENNFRKNEKWQDLCRKIRDLDGPSDASLEQSEFVSSDYHNLETLYSDLNRFDKKINLVSNKTIDVLSQLLAKMVVDESCIKQIDLGAFKHREDLNARDRKLAILCFDTLFKKFDIAGIHFAEPVNSVSVLELGLKAILQSISIDMNNSGDDLYPSTVSLMSTLTALNASVLVSAIPNFLNSLLKTVSSCPVGKRDGVNHSGVVLGQLIVSVVSLIHLVADDAGLSMRTIVSRDFSVLIEIIKIIEKEKTEGSILLATHQTIASDVVDII